MCIGVAISRFKTRRWRAIAIVLLVSAGLLIRSLRTLQNVQPGFRSDHALSVQVALPEASYGDEKKQAAFYRALVPRLAALPGVQKAAVGYPLPLSGERYRLVFQAEGQPAEVTDLPRAEMTFVSPDYFATLGIPLRQGRAFNDRDGLGGEQVAVVNRALAGTAAGLLGAFFLARVLGSLLYGVSTRDPWTFVGVPLLLLAVALIATWIPARRATRVEPVVALRYE